jgi:hypothetical protein
VEILVLFLVVPYDVFEGMPAWCAETRGKKEFDAMATVLSSPTQRVILCNISWET